MNPIERHSAGLFRDEQRQQAGKALEAWGHFLVVIGLVYAFFISLVILAHEWFGGAL